MTRHTADRLFWYCVASCPLPSLLLWWEAWIRTPPFIFEGYPLLTPAFLASYAWTIAFVVALFQPIGRPKKLVLVLLVPVACGFVLLIAYALLMFKLVGFRL